MKQMDVQAVGGALKMAKIVKGADYFGVTIPEKEAFALMDRYIELGGNTIDTARIYGKVSPEDEYSHSEPIVGRWMKARGNRGELVLVTKGAHPDRSNLTKSRLCREVVESELAVSLDALGVDSVDIYFLHRDNPAMPVSEIMDILDEQVKAGKMRALGASNWTCARIAEANAYAKSHGKTPFTISQIQWGLAHTTPKLWDDSTLLCMDKTEYAGYQESGIPVMGFSCQGSGYFSKLLAGQKIGLKVAARYDNAINRRRLEILRDLCESTGHSPAALAMAFLTSSPVQSAAVVGCSSVEQLEDTMSDCDLTLDAADWAALLG